METLHLTQEWDKTFPKSNRVEHTPCIPTCMTTSR